MSTWKYVVQRARTGELLSLDVPLAVSSLTWDLSGSGALSATAEPDTGALRAEDGRLMFEPWNTLLYAEADGEIRWGGVVIDCKFTGEKWAIEAAGFTSLLFGTPFGGDYTATEVRVDEVLRVLWADAQASPMGNLGVEVVSPIIPATLGEPKRTEHDDPSTEDRDAAIKERDERLAKNPRPEPTKRETEGLNGTDREIEAKPYVLAWHETRDIGSELSSLVTVGQFDWSEEHYWSGASTVGHRFRAHYPRRGTSRDDLSFVQGVNITNVIPVEIKGDDYANEVTVLGAGEGAASIRATTAVDDGRIRRVRVLTDKSITDKARATALAADELARHRGVPDITSISVKDHPHARIGSWVPGDDITVEATIPWIGDVAIRCRITSWTLTSDSTADLSLVLSDNYRYGA